MLIERIGAVSGYNSHKEIDFGSKLALPALLADFRNPKKGLSLPSDFPRLAQNYNCKYISQRSFFQTALVTH
jgi:hypothetical protein